MYNLIMGFRDTGIFHATRFGEYTQDAIKAYMYPNGIAEPSRVTNLPTLVMPEIGDRTSIQVARVGNIEGLALSGNELRFRFVPSPSIPDIPSNRIQDAAAHLGITDWEFSRTHWAVKDIDLYRVINERIIGVDLTPRVFRLPRETLREPDLVAVMMPFDAGFSPVYETLRQAVAETGLRCQRADDIWLNDHIMDDVASLIWRSRVVISDLTGKNPNVFYETGIAHTVGRDVIQSCSRWTTSPLIFAPSALSDI